MIYILLIPGLISLSCHQNPEVPAVIKAEIKPVKIDLGDTSRLVTITVDVAKAKHPEFEFTDLPYDKKKGFMLMKDDGLLTDYTIVYKILSGGIVNGIRYPGFTFNDGTGKKIGYKYSFAINPNENHTNNTNNEDSWNQIIEMIAAGHTFMNHSLFHGGNDKLKAIKDAEKNMWNHTHYRMTEFVVPGGDEGFVETGLQLGYNLISSEFGEPVPDGNNNPGNQNISWGSYIPITDQHINKVLVSRTNLGDQWNTGELMNAEKFIDYIFNRPDKNKKLIGTAFSHGPFSDHKDAAVNFNKLMMYIKNHPANKDSVLMTSSKDLMDYLKTKTEVVISSQKFDPDKNQFTIILDMGKVNPNVTSRNLSLKILNAKINNVQAKGVNDVTFNPATGLINIYKTDRSKVIDPFKDALPPQIINITGNQKTISITYDKPVTQNKMLAYQVIGNKVLKLYGSDKLWKLDMQNTVASSQTLNYRMQSGNAAEKNKPSFKVCTYTNMPVKLN